MEEVRVDQSQELSTQAAESPHSALSGRELDAAVAERVMRFDSVESVGGDYRYHNAVLDEERGGRWTSPVPKYSADMAAAMEVLNKADGMWELTRCVERQVLDDDSTPFVLRYRCSLRFGDNLGHASGCATAPEAICRAALAAVRQTEFDALARDFAPELEGT